MTKPKSNPLSRLEIAKLGGRALADTLGSAGMRKLGVLSARGTPKNISQVTKLGKQNVASGFLDRIRTREGSQRGAIRSLHLRWHVLRNKPNPRCELCIELIERATLSQGSNK